MESTIPTIAETIAETILVESIPETIPEVIEVAETIDYTPLLTQIAEATENMEYFLFLLAGFGVFAVVVALCYFCYKFFRIFF